MKRTHGSLHRIASHFYSQCINMILFIHLDITYYTSVLLKR